MKSDDVKTLLYIGLGAVAMYYIYQAIKGIGGGVDSAAQSFANWYVDFTAPPVTPLGNAIFADGSYVPMANIQPNWQGNALLFQYQGRTFQLASHDSNGNYPATPVS